MNKGSNTNKINNESDLDLSSCKKVITKLDAEYNKPNVGEKWYAISTEWWEKFQDFDFSSLQKVENVKNVSNVKNVENVSNGSKDLNLGINGKEVIGKIDNLGIYDESLEGLKGEAQEEADFVLKHEKVWKQLVEWFGGEPEISFEVVLNGANEPTIDIFPAKFAVTIEENASNGKEEDKEKEKLIGESDTLISRTGVNERREIVMKKEKKKPDNVLSVSRYTKMRDLKGIVAKHVKKSPKALKLLLKSTDEEEKSEFQVIEETDENFMNQTIGDALPKSGLIYWDLLVEVFDVNTRRMSVMKKFSIANPEVGQRLDAKKNDVWYEAVIAEVIEQQDDKAAKKPEKGAKTPKKVKVHFLSFESKEDEIYSADSEDLKAPYEKVPDWRTQIRVGEKVEINKKYYSSSTGWSEAEVVRIDRNGTKLKRSTSLFEKGQEENKTMMGKLVDGVKRLVNPGKNSKRGSYDRKKSDKSIKSSKESSAATRYMRGPSKSKRAIADKDDKDALNTESSEDNSHLEKKEDTSFDDKEEDAEKKFPPVSEHGLILLRVPKSGPSVYGYSSLMMFNSKEVVVDLGSEFIAPEHTHIQRTQRGYFASLKNSESIPDHHGLVGLRNLGNTCYMNSSLQCLIATRVISEYFTSGAYKKDINRRNPLGFGGRIATQYGKLMEEVFSDKYSSIAPTAFKNVIGNSFTNFQGYGQQDSHEFVSLLLDGLHEDLNRVKNKKYIESDDDNKKSDAELAKIEWDNYLARNQSVFVDNMYGQLKSHLVCPECNNEATKFDSFGSLAVPIPINDCQYIKIAYMMLQPKWVKIIEDDSSKVETHELLTDEPEDKNSETLRQTHCIRFVFEVNDGILSGTAVAKFLMEKTGVKREDLLVCDLKSNKPDQVLFDPDKKKQSYFDLRWRSDVELVAYELDPLPVVETVLEVKVEPETTENVTEGETTEKPESAEEEAEKSKEQVPNTSANSQVKDVEKTKKTMFFNFGKTKANDNDKLKGGSKDVDTFKAPEKTEDKTAVGHQLGQQGTAETPDGARNYYLGQTNGSTYYGSNYSYYNPYRQTSGKLSEDSDGDHDDTCYLAVNYKVDHSYMIKSLRMSDFIRFRESETKMYDLFAMIWKKCKFMFDVDEMIAKKEKEIEEKIKGGKYKKMDIDENVITSAEAEIMNELVTLCYERRDLEISSKSFKLGTQYNASYIEVKLTRTGIKSLAPGIKEDCPRKYYMNETIETMDEALNLGFIAHDESVSKMLTELQKELTLYDCFDAFRLTEKLEKKNEWYCNKCKNFVQATKKMDVYKTGPILVIALKRFRGERTRREKLTHVVDFPIRDLDLTQYIEDDTQECKLYDLYAVSCHMGGLGGGHYIAKVKDMYNEHEEDTWFEMNDSSVRPTSEDSIVSESAYVLYYQRKDMVTQKNNRLVVENKDNLKNEDDKEGFETDEL